MNTIAWGLALVTVSAATTAVAVKTLSDAPAPNDAQIDALVTRVDAMESRLTDFGDRVAAALERAERPERAVARSEARPLGATMADDEISPFDDGSGAIAARGPEEPVDEDALDLDAFAAKLRAGGMSDDEVEKMWRKIVKAGKIDDAIDILEEMAELNPNDPDLQAHLGSAYIQKLMTVPDLARGEYAMRADGAFDAALKLNPKHWDARFSKAISLSFWPPIMGKQPEAIRQFETLLQNQEGSGYSDPKHAQTYQYLGNLYLQSGNTAKAKEVFQKGLASFPTNETLAQAIADLD